MHFSLDTIAAFLAASTTMAVAFPVAAMTDSVVKRGFDNSLFVSFCGAPLSGEESSLYLGNGVAPYSLVSVDADTGALIQEIESNITTNRYSWFTNGDTLQGAHFKLTVTDSTGVSANSSATTMGTHPGGPSL